MKPGQNKAKLFHFLAERIGSVATEGKQLCTTLENNVVCAFHINNVHDLTPCDNKEADTRIILHTLHCAKQGYGRVIIKTVDTYVLFLAVAAFTQHLSCVKVALDRFRSKYIPIHRYIWADGIAEALGGEKAEALPFFHIFTGCLLME